MPARRLRSPLAQAVTPVAAGLAVLALLALALWGCAAWVGRGDSSLEVRLGDDEFNVGPAARRAERIAEHGPLLFPGLLGPDQGYIMVAHTGDDPRRGWHAFAATPPGSPISCTVSWDADRRRLVDPCTGKAYPATGEGLAQFPVYLTPDRDVLVDLTPAGRPGGGSSTTAAG